MAKKQKDNTVNLPKSTREERAARVKLARNMAGLSKTEMCGNEINASTYRNWENALHTGLSKRGAWLIIERVKKENVICSFEWLYAGIGSAPQKVLGLTEKNTNETELSFIAEELSTLKKHHPDIVELVIKNNDLMPIFHKGDYLAGIKIPLDQADSINDHFCLVLLANGDLKLKRLRILENKEFVVISDVIQTSAQQEEFINKTEIVFVAPIIWHRKQPKAN